MSLVKCMESTFGVLAEVAAERRRQDAKWGPQDHPSVSFVAETMDAETRALFYGVISEERAKRQCEHRFGIDLGSYADIAIEEVAEAVCALDDDARRAELVQCAAVFVAWIESIDRRNSRASGSVSMEPPVGSGETTFPPEVYA